MDNVCSKCGMIRSKKDLVLMEDNSWLCFSCWNKYLEKDLKKMNKVEVKYKKKAGAKLR